MFKISSILSKAKSLNKTIVFPEAEFSPRTIKAVEILLKKHICNVILLGSPEKIISQSNHLKRAVIIDNQSSELNEEFASRIAQLRAHKGVTLEMARELVKDKMYFATMLVLEGYADGMVAGAETATSNVLRPALQLIKTKDGIKTASSCFMMVGTSKLSFGENNVLFASDCAFNINPSADELKDITFATCQTAKALANIQPKVALLSFSTLGSGGDKDETILKMRQALSLIKQQDSSLLVDGEMQLDCAILPSVAKVKAPNSVVAGKANILIFPDLNSGNIGYKIMQRFGSLNAVGVIVQGLNKPVSDLSRGASVDDIVNMSAVTAIQSVQ